MLDVDLSLFRGAFRNSIREILSEQFPERDFPEVFEAIAFILDEGKYRFGNTFFDNFKDKSGTISIYEYNEFTLEGDILMRFQWKYTEIQEHRRMQEELRKKREEEEEARRVAEELKRYKKIA